VTTARELAAWLVRICTARNSSTARAAWSFPRAGSGGAGYAALRACEPALIVERPAGRLEPAVYARCSGIQADSGRRFGSASRVRRMPTSDPRLTTTAPTAAATFTSTQPKPPSTRLALTGRKQLQSRLCRSSLTSVSDMSRLFPSSTLCRRSSVPDGPHLKIVTRLFGELGR
jgi:hypothetical protein